MFRRVFRRKCARCFIRSSSPCSSGGQEHSIAFAMHYLCWFVCLITSGRRCHCNTIVVACLLGYVQVTCKSTSSLVLLYIAAICEIWHRFLWLYRFVVLPYFGCLGVDKFQDKGSTLPCDRRAVNKSSLYYFVLFFVWACCWDACTVASGALALCVWTVAVVVTQSRCDCWQPRLHGRKPFLIFMDLLPCVAIICCVRHDIE